MSDRKPLASANFFPDSWHFRHSVCNSPNQKLFQSPLCGLTWSAITPLTTSPLSRQCLHKGCCRSWKAARFCQRPKPYQRRGFSGRFIAKASGIDAADWVGRRNRPRLRGQITGEPSGRGEEPLVISAAFVKGISGQKPDFRAEAPQGGVGHFDLRGHVREPATSLRPKCFASGMQSKSGGLPEFRRKIRSCDNDGDVLPEHLDQDALAILAAHAGIDHVPVAQRSTQDGQAFAFPKAWRWRELHQPTALLALPERDHLARNAYRAVAVLEQAAHADRGADRAPVRDAGHKQVSRKQRCNSSRRFF